jgi:hypothetical protein
MGSLRLVTATSTANPNTHDLYLDDSGQLEWLGGNILDRESYAQMIAQRIACRLKFVRREWYLDIREGTPWRESIWRKGTTKDVIARVFRDVIESTPGVQDLRTIDVQISGRHAIISLEAVSDRNTQVTTDQLDAPIVVDLSAGQM